MFLVAFHHGFDQYLPFLLDSSGISACNKFFSVFLADKSCNNWSAPARIFLPTLWTTWNLILVVSTPSSSVSQKHYKLQLWSLHVPSLFRLLKRRFSRRVYWCKDIWFSTSYFNLPAKSAIFQFFNSLYMLSSPLLADAAMTSSVLEELDLRFDFLRFLWPIKGG